MKAGDFRDLYALEESFWWFAGMRAITAALLDPFCPPGRERTVLDAGCGTGYNVEWLRGYAGGGRVFGLDVSEDALEFCRHRGLANLSQGSVTALPFSDSSFDLVTSFDVLVQLPDGGDVLAAREMHRVLRPGGVAFVRAAAYPRLCSGHDEALGSQRRYDRAGLIRLLEQAGFAIRRATYANALLLPVAVLRRLVLKRLGLADPGSDVKPLSPALSWLDPLMRSVLLAEARWLRSSGTGLPAGLSVICIAERA